MYKLKENKMFFTYFSIAYHCLINKDAGKLKGLGNDVSTNILLFLEYEFCCHPQENVLYNLKRFTDEHISRIPMRNLLVDYINGMFKFKEKTTVAANESLQIKKKARRA